MQRMKLEDTSKVRVIPKENLHERLLAVLDRAYATGVNDGLPTAWLYDCTIAAVAVKLVLWKVNQIGSENPVAQKLVSDLEAVDFNVYGEVGIHAFDEAVSARKKKFAEEVVAPLYEAYKANTDVMVAYPGADGLLLYIIEQWVSKT